jgi:hypothetical protein
MPITPDPGIKNVIIKKELLGKVTSSNAKILRFRIVAEDKNRKSAYSPIFSTQSSNIVPGIGRIIRDEDSNTILANWSSGDVSTQILYDVFVGFDSADPVYKATTGSTSYLFLNSGTTSVRVVVQAGSINPAFSEDLIIFDSGTFSLV